MSRSICIIVPCYNEAERLNVFAFRRFAAEHPNVQFVMVNDGSRDNTLGLLEALHERAPQQFEVLNLETNQGKAEAVRRGVLNGLNRCPDYVGYWDADLATPLEAIIELGDLLQKRSDLDLIIASRFPLLGRNIERQWIRKRVGQICGGLASIALGTRIQDTQCGAKLFRTSTVARHVFSQPMTSRWLFDVEVFARLIQTWNALGDRPFQTRVFEYPLHYWTEIPGSKLKKMDFLKAGFELSRIYLRYLQPFAKTPNISQIGKANLPPAHEANKADRAA